MDTEFLTIKQVADATGLSEHTLRYYERIGLILTINRNESGYRRYTSMDVDWINFLNKLRSTGMSIQQMIQYAELQRHGDSTLPQRLEILKTHRCQVQARIDELGEHMKTLNWKVEVYSELLEKSADLC